MADSLLAIVGASLLSFFFVFLGVSDRVLQSIVSVFTIILAVTLGRKFLNYQKAPLPRWLKPALLASTAFTLQMLTVSTGGLYSPLLVMIHIFALGTSFLVSLLSSLVFLALSVGILISNILLKPSLLEIFRSDPFSASLYLISFVIIIPLSRLLAKSYLIKDAVSKVLNEYIEFEELKSVSILAGLNDLVIILDSSFRVSSVNYATERALKINQNEATGHILLELLSLTKSDGKKVTLDDLSLNQTLEDGANRIVDNLRLELKEESSPKPVRVNIRPIVDSGGKIKQIVLIVTNYREDSPTFQSHLNLAHAQTQYSLRMENLKKNLAKFKPNQLKLEVELLTHIQEDLLLSFEVTDHPTIPNFILENIQQLSDNLVRRKQSFSEALGVILRLTRSNSSTLQPGVNSYLTTKVDTVGLSTALAKLIEMAVLLSSEKTNSIVEVTAGYGTPSRIEVKTQYILPENTQIHQILSMYYPGGLEDKTNLKYGSGLEGFIAATLCSHLGMDLTVEIRPYLKFTIILGNK